MPDSRDPFTDLAKEADTVDIPPVAEIRRKGDRRRTIRRALTAVAALAIVAALGFGVFVAAPMLERNRSPQWAGTTDPTPPPSSPAVTAPTPPTMDNVATMQMVFPEDSSMIQVFGEYEGDAALAGRSLLCAPDVWNSGSDPGGEAATTVLTRVMGMTPEVPSYAMVRGYASTEAASAAYDRIVAEASDCRAQLKAAGMSELFRSEATPFDIPAGTVTRTPARAEYVVAVGSAPGSEMGTWVDVLVVQSGERIAWVHQAYEGQDHNCSPTAGSQVEVQCALPKSLIDIARQLDR